MESLEDTKVMKEKIIKTAQVLGMYMDIRNKHAELKKKHNQLNDEFSILKLENNMKSFQYVEQSKQVEHLKIGHDKLTSEYNSLKSSYDKQLSDLVSLQMKYQVVCRDLKDHQNSEEIYPVEPERKKKVTKRQKLVKKYDDTSAEDTPDEKPFKSSRVLNNSINNEMNIKIEILGNEENVKYQSLNNSQIITKTENFKSSDESDQDYLLELKKCREEKSILIKNSEEREMNMHAEWQEKERKLKGKIEELQLHIEKEKNILLENFKVKESEMKKKWEEKEQKLKTKIADLKKKIGEEKSALTRSFEEKISGMKKEWQEKEQIFKLDLELMKHKNQEEISILKGNFEKKEANMRLEWQKNENDLKIEISNLKEKLDFLERSEKCQKNVTNMTVQNSQDKNNSMTPLVSIFDDQCMDYSEQKNTSSVEELKQDPIKTSCSEDSENDENILNIFQEMRMVMLSPIPESPLQQDLLLSEDDDETPIPETAELSNKNDLKLDLSEEPKVSDWKDRYLANRIKKEIKYHRLSTIKKAKQKFWLELSQTFTKNKKRAQSARQTKKAPIRNSSTSTEISEATGGSNTIVNGIASVFADLVTQKMHNSRTRARATSERNVLEVNKMLLEKAKQENETKNLYKNEKRYSSDDEAVLRQNKSGMDYEKHVESNIGDVSYERPHAKHSSGMETPSFVDSCYESIISNSPSVQSLIEETMVEDKKENKQPTDLNQADNAGMDSSLVNFTKSTETAASTYSLTNHSKTGKELQLEETTVTEHCNDNTSETTATGNYEICSADVEINVIKVVSDDNVEIADNKMTDDSPDLTRNPSVPQESSLKLQTPTKLLLDEATVSEHCNYHMSETTTTRNNETCTAYVGNDAPKYISEDRAEIANYKMTDTGHMSETTITRIYEICTADVENVVPDDDAENADDKMTDDSPDLTRNSSFSQGTSLELQTPTKLELDETIVTEHYNYHMGETTTIRNDETFTADVENDIPKDIPEDSEEITDNKMTDAGHMSETSSTRNYENCTGGDGNDVTKKNSEESFETADNEMKDDSPDLTRNSSIPQESSLELHLDEKIATGHCDGHLSETAITRNYETCIADDDVPKDSSHDSNHEFPLDETTGTEHYDGYMSETSSTTNYEACTADVENDIPEDFSDDSFEIEDNEMTDATPELKRNSVSLERSLTFQIPTRLQLDETTNIEYCDDHMSETTTTTNYETFTSDIKEAKDFSDDSFEIADNKMTEDSTDLTRNSSVPQESSLKLPTLTVTENCDGRIGETTTSMNYEIITTDVENDVTKDFSDDSFEIADNKVTEDSPVLKRNSSVAQEESSSKLPTPTKGTKRKRPQKGTLMAKSIKIYNLRSSVTKGNQMREIEASGPSNTETNNSAVTNQEKLKKSPGATRAKRRRLSSPLKSAEIGNRSSQMPPETLNNSISLSVNNKIELSPSKRKKSITVEPPLKQKPVKLKKGPICTAEAEPTISSVQQSQKLERPSTSSNPNNESNRYSQEGKKMLASSLDRSKINIIQDILLKPKNKSTGNTERKTSGFKRPLATKILPLCPQSPPLVEGEVTNYVEPVIIPLDKPKVLESSKAAALFRKLITYSTEEKTVEEVARHFSNQEPAYISRLILQQIIQDKEKPDAKVPRAPLMTHTQRVMFGLMLRLEKMNVSGLINTYLETSELYLINTKVLAQIEPLTRLNVAICKSHGYIERMRKFCLEAFYFMGDLAIPFFFTVLTSWIEVLPPAAESEGFPLVKVLVQLVHLKTCNRPGYNLLPLRDLLHKFYEYPNEPWNSETFFKELFNNYLKNPVAPADFPILLYFKNNDCKWVFQKINSLIKPILSNVNVNFKATLIVLIGNIMSQFPKRSNLEYIESAREWLESIDQEQDVPEVVKKSISYALMKLPRTGKRKITQSQEKQHVQNVDKPNM
ncbi:uncharacterized protein LOC123321435 [Coccinella septempunctata]|uniref:uncharacterized protein LOC123321435 n=1 Tax=Coccinella septempunctata TaxID=41139 RepID=UPI001D07B1D3|nr:uncharacterized protein LOC123321435 [Coccinella septempunctata]